MTTATESGQKSVIVKVLWIPTFECLRHLYAPRLALEVVIYVYLRLIAYHALTTKICCYLKSGSAADLSFPQSMDCSPILWRFPISASRVYCNNCRPGEAEGYLLPQLHTRLGHDCY